MVPARRAPRPDRGRRRSSRRCRRCCGRPRATATTSSPSRRSAPATAFTTVLRAYLGRLGYHVHKWGQDEILALHRLSTVAVKRLEEISDEAGGGKVTLIGHSLGGIYAREVARAAPDHVRRVITVGSPFAGDLRSNVVWPMYEAVTGTRIKSIPPEVMDRLNEPLPVPSTAIYSSSDGVVSWQSCIDAEAPTTDNVEVPGSHIGLLHNPAVLYVIADRLAEPEGSTAAVRAVGLAAARRPARPGPRRQQAARMTATELDNGTSRMSRMEAAFLAMEQPSAPNHLGSLMIFGPRDGRPLTYDTVTALVAERLARLPSARRKVAEVPFGLGRPSWTTDRSFDIEYHVRQTALPPGGDEAALARLVGLAHAAPLDRSRPAVGAVGHRGPARPTGSPCTPRSTWRRSTTPRAPS